MRTSDVTASHEVEGEGMLHERLQNVLDQAPAACFEATPDGEYVFVNRAWSAMASGSRAEDALGRGWLNLVHIEDRERVDKAWREAILRHRDFSMEFRLEPPAGEIVWVASQAGPIRDRHGQIEGYLGWLTNITKRIDLERYLENALMDQMKVTEQLRREETVRHAVEQQFRAVFERAPLAISIVDFEGKFSQVNQALCDMTGFEAEQLLGQPADTVLHPDARPRANHEVVHQLFTVGAPHASLEQQLLRADGRTRWFLSDSSLVRDDDDAPMYVLTISIDITERKLFEERLAHEASHDPLTGLPNRSLMRELMQQSFARTRRREATMAIMFVDLDHFKSVNDEHGHAQGDEALEVAAVRLRNALRLGDVVARYGGDEFVLLCEDIGGEAGAGMVADRVCEAMTAPFELSESSVSIGASVGVALTDGDGDMDELLRCADKAVYAAKAGGRGRYVIAERTPMLFEAESP